jgi:PrtD family type I secretion system ABC transporter
MLGRRSTDPVSEVFAANRSVFIAGLGFSAGMSILALTTSIYMLQVYDRVLTSRSEATLLLLTLMAVIGIAVFAVMDSLRRRLMFRMSLRISDALAPRVLRAMVATNSQAGNQVVRTGLRDVETLRNFIGGATFGALMDAPFLVIYLFILLLLHPLYLLVVVVGAVILLLIAWLNNGLTGPPLTESISTGMRAQSFADGGLRNADVLEGMGISSGFANRWYEQWLQSMRLNALASERDARLSALSKGIRMVVQVAFLATGAILILDFRATGAVMIGASIIGARALMPIETLISSWKSIVAARLAKQRLSELLSEAPRRDEGMRLPAPRGHLKLSGAFYVASRTRKTVLSNISFELQPGESMGVIGPSASGKSTLARIIMGAWPVNSGSVRLDGANVYSWPRQDLSRYVGYLPQDVELFSGTIRANITRMGDEDPEAVVRAAQLAGAHEMILALPKGYETEIGDNGHLLSGGQAQRIGLVRALYCEPRLIVLDEPNANLDSFGEAALMQTLAELKKIGSTVVVIAHRPGILMGMDKILVLNPQGGVAAFGPAADVMRQFTQKSEGEIAKEIVREAAAPIERAASGA